MAKFVEVGRADLFDEDGRIAGGEIPEVVQIENDPRRRIGSVRIGLKAAGALEQAQEVGLEPLVQHRLVRNGLVKGDDRVRSGAEFGGQAGADALDTLFRESVEVGLQAFRLEVRSGGRETGKP